ncbi:MAG: hypothetical protein M3169_08440 [Candidatus Eremiobacteraeota bacterium]|nr:hypothetical protein [Candidatus Eremiobacteraeota bacterium]
MKTSATFVSRHVTRAIMLHIGELKHVHEGGACTQSVTMTREGTIARRT